MREAGDELVDKVLNLGKEIERGSKKN